MQDPLTPKLRQLEKAITEIMHRLPAMIGAEVVRFSVASWDMEGWRGPAFEPWKQTKYTKKGGRILLKTGRLRRSIRIARVTADYVVIATDVPYAKIHNDGFAGLQTVKGYTRNKYKKQKAGTGVYSTKTRKERQRTVTSVSGTSQVKTFTRYMRIPRRHFLGDSPQLRYELRKMIAAQLIMAANRI